MPFYYIVLDIFTRLDFSNAFHYLRNIKVSPYGQINPQLPSGKLRRLLPTKPPATRTDVPQRFIAIIVCALSPTHLMATNTKGFHRTLVPRHNRKKPDDKSHKNLNQRKNNFQT